jgi:hypothetical protein
MRCNPCLCASLGGNAFAGVTSCFIGFFFLFESSVHTSHLELTNCSKRSQYESHEFNHSLVGDNKGQLDDNWCHMDDNWCHRQLVPPTYYCISSAVIKFANALCPLNRGDLTIRQSSYLDLECSGSENPDLHY